MMSKDGNKEVVLSSVKKDIVGEVGNISMSTAATTLSSILKHQVMVTTPRVTCIPFKQIVKECDVPKVVTSIEFKEGLTGQNLLMMDVRDALVIADLMMGGDGKAKKEVFSDIELSAVGEAMNQMIGSASTSMATMLNKEIDIMPPSVDVWDNKENIDLSRFDLEGYICKIAFDLTVEGLIESEMMQVFVCDTVDEIVDIMVGGGSDTGGNNMQEDTMEKEGTIKEEVVEVKEEKLEPGLEEDRLTERNVEAKKPVFPQFSRTNNRNTNNRNLDLIMDVPLEFSAVLGKSKKTIKEVLSLTNGSIVELNKLADEPLEIHVNGKLIAQGEVVVINENFGIRITTILTKEERIQNLS